MQKAANGSRAGIGKEGAQFRTHISLTDGLLPTQLRQLQSHTPYIRNPSSLHSLPPQILHFSAAGFVFFLYIHCHSSAPYASLQALSNNACSPAPVQPQTRHRDLKKKTQGELQGESGEERKEKGGDGEALETLATTKSLHPTL